MHLTERRRNMLSGAISLVLVIGLLTFGIKRAFSGVQGYTLTASFDAAGQGLIDGSDVKIRGVNVGEVSGVELEDGRALVTLKISDDQQIPRSAQAVVRPKTLFGEKFVDIVPGAGEGKGPYYADGDVIAETVGGFELERVLSDAYPLLQAIDAGELGTILDELAIGADGMGESVNRQIVNSEKLTDISARHDADTKQLLNDLANLSDELAGRAEDLVAGARDLNVALPTLNSRGDELQVVLEQASRLSADLADLLEANRGFLHEVTVDGGKGLELLDAHRSQIVPLLKGLRQYTQTLAQAIRIELDDGSLMGAVKGLLGTEICGPVDCAVNQSFAATGSKGSTAGDASNPTPVDAIVDGLEPAPQASGSAGIADLLTGLLGGGR